MVFVRVIAFARFKGKNITPARAHKGIYDGKGLMHGYKPTFSDKKTKKVWKPNIQKKSYYSEILEEKLRYEMSTSAMRSIDRAGGFDDYILKTNNNRLVSKAAINLKEKMKKVVELKEQGLSIAEIRQKLKSEEPSQWKHHYKPIKYTNRFYFEWKGRKHVVYC